MSELTEILLSIILIVSPVSLVSFCIYLIVGEEFYPHYWFSNNISKEDFFKIIELLKKGDVTDVNYDSIIINDIRFKKNTEINYSYPCCNILQYFIYKHYWNKRIKQYNKLQKRIDIKKQIVKLNNTLNTLPDVNHEGKSSIARE